MDQPNRRSIPTRRPTRDPIPSGVLDQSQKSSSRCHREGRLSFSLRHRESETVVRSRRVSLAGVLAPLIKRTERVRERKRSPEVEIKERNKVEKKRGGGEAERQRRVERRRGWRGARKEKERKEKRVEGGGGGGAEQ